MIYSIIANGQFLRESTVIDTKEGYLNVNKVGFTQEYPDAWVCLKRATAVKAAKLLASKVGGLRMISVVQNYGLADQDNVFFTSSDKC